MNVNLKQEQVVVAYKCRNNAIICIFIIFLKYILFLIFRSYHLFKIFPYLVWQSFLNIWELAVPSEDLEIAMNSLSLEKCIYIFMQIFVNSFYLWTTRVLDLRYKAKK